jgi:Spy/CpxP family protein refolding chaperone
MKRATIILAAMCSLIVGVSMAFTLHLLHMRMRGGGDSAGMPAGMDHAAHMKMMMDQLQAMQGHHHPGQEDTPDPRPEFSSIKSLTADEVTAYQAGTGHGMAKAAEQNHYPGPRHVLDLAAQLQLSKQQTEQIEKAKDAMTDAAIKIGNQIIENERKLNAAFVSKTIDQSQLDSLVKESAALQGQLRLAHLSAHLQIYKILTSEQIAKYDQLRGYSGSGGEKANAGSAPAPAKSGS